MNKQQTGLLQVLWCLPPGCSFPCFPQISEGFFLLLVFIYVSEVYVFWRSVWAAGRFSWKKMWWSQGRMSSQRCFVEISLAGDRSVFLQGLEPAQQYQATWIFYSHWISGHRSMQDLIMPLHCFFPCLLNIPACVFVPANSVLVPP